MQPLIAPPSTIWLVQRGAQEAGFILSDAEVNKYIVLNDEFTSNLPRVYCYKQECNAYIPAEDRTEAIGWCWNCEVETCFTCRKAAHAGPCDEELLEQSREADEKLFRLAEELGWKKCPTCHAMIERIEGCNCKSLFIILNDFNRLCSANILSVLTQVRCWLNRTYGLYNTNSQTSCPCGQAFCYKCGIPEQQEQEGVHFHDSDLEDNADNNNNDEDGDDGDDGNDGNDGDDGDDGDDGEGNGRD